MKAADVVEDSEKSILAHLTLFVPDVGKALAEFVSDVDENGNQKMTVGWTYRFDTGLSDEENVAIGRELDSVVIRPYVGREKSSGIWTAWSESRAAEAEDFYGMYGSLFFIGILLSAVFLVAAVLIIYYKQVSEGYEDVKRFDIMQKVGMTKKDIRSSIRSQLLTVFALPLVFAGLHLVFAFPMIRKMLMLFNLYNVSLFMRTTAVSFVAFAIFYAVVYRLTSGVYYRIVSNADTRD